MRHGRLSSLASATAHHHPLHLPESRPCLDTKPLSGGCGCRLTGWVPDELSGPQNEPSFLRLPSSFGTDTCADPPVWLPRRHPAAGACIPGLDAMGDARALGIQYNLSICCVAPRPWLQVWNSAASTACSKPCPRAPKPRAFHLSKLLTLSRLLSHQPSSLCRHLTCLTSPGVYRVSLVACYCIALPLVLLYWYTRRNSGPLRG